MTEKEIFITKLKSRTKQFAVDVIKFCHSLKTSKASAVIIYQLIKSATSTGANYRSACRARSKAEFFSKICIVVEEVDESKFWLEIIEESNLTGDKRELNRLNNEAKEILKIVSKTKSTTYAKTK